MVPFLLACLLQEVRFPLLTEQNPSARQRSCSPTGFEGGLSAIPFPVRFTRPYPVLWGFE